MAKYVDTRTSPEKKPPALTPEEMPGGVYVHPQTGATSGVPVEGYVYIPKGYQLQQGASGAYGVAKPPVDKGGAHPYSEPFKQYKAPTTALGYSAPDPFDLKIREAAMNDLLLSRKTTNRKSTFTIGPRGIQGPLKTVLG